MFYFTIKIISYMIILLTTYYLLNKKTINILEIIILLFIFNTCIFSLYNNLSIIYTIIICFILISIYYLYMYLYNINISKKIIDGETVLINRGIINFNELIKENISLDNLLYELKKKGISNPNLVDYCIKKDNNLIIFRKNSIKNYPISLIIDGKVLKDNLFSIHKSIEWLDKKIIENNLNLDNINYAYFKNKEVYFITN